MEALLGGIGGVQASPDNCGDEGGPLHIWLKTEESSCNFK